MWQNGNDAYLESRVYSAEPVELVRLLYQAAIGAVRDARQHLASGVILERSRAVSRAHAILTELSSSLDHERGGDISIRLAQLYDYIQRRLLAANLEQSDRPLAEALGLLTTLSEAWDGLKAAEKPIAAAPRESAWAPAMMGEPEVAAYGSHAWSF